MHATVHVARAYGNHTSCPSSETSLRFVKAQGVQ